ncbi:HNH endonuclease [Enterococcus phage vB_Efm3_KEN20]
MKEIWKDIEGYEGVYHVSNLGRVKRVATNRVLQPYRNKVGYLLVYLCKNGKRKTHRIHRLVAQSFIPNPENKPEVNHLDENKINNMVSNLEWSTRKENCNYGTRNERLSIPIIATNLKTGESREFYGSNECARQLALNTAHITSVLKGRLKQTGGYTFQYKEEEE